MSAHFLRAALRAERCPRRLDAKDGLRVPAHVADFGTFDPKRHDWGAYAFDELYQDLVAVARRYGASETSSRRNLVLAHSMGCSLALRLAAEWGTNGVSVAALALLGATDVVPAVAASLIFRLPLCLLDQLQPLLSAGFEARALHEETRAGMTACSKSRLAGRPSRRGLPRLAALLAVGGGWPSEARSRATTWHLACSQSLSKRASSQRRPFPTFLNQARQPTTASSSSCAR